MTDAYYQLVDPFDPMGERFSASDHAISGWAPGTQNAAPVSALLVRALERCSPRPDARLSRVAVDLLGPVPVSDRLRVCTRIQRAGMKTELLRAELTAPGPDGQPRLVACATAWRFQLYDTDDLCFSPAPPLRPLHEGSTHIPTRTRRRTYIHSLEWRWLNDIRNCVPGECWARPVVDLVKGESLTPLQRLFTVADIANGVGGRLATTEWFFLNTDLIVHIHRVPDGEWIGVRAETHYGPDGVGVSRGTLFDEHGSVAAIQQAQLLRRRE